MDGYLHFCGSILIKTIGSDLFTFHLISHLIIYQFTYVLRGPRLVKLQQPNDNMLVSKAIKGRVPYICAIL